MFSRRLHRLEACATGLWRPGEDAGAGRPPLFPPADFLA